ncbi:MAG: type II toxin-antitoxin system RelE/ParE family toxin [Prevotella sp.]|nr:type II toxin-antitoxin system RelE/ParE family toxin [Prevotella sp.]
MKVIWMPQAKCQVRDIAKYIRKEFGKNARDSFIRGVRESSRQIGQSPSVGIVEPLLEDCAEKYRSYLVNRLNKIIYRVADDHIEVVDFWDVRREPSSLAEQVK